MTRSNLNLSSGQYNGTKVSQGRFIVVVVSMNAPPLITNVLLQENPPDTFWVWFDGILVMVKTYLEDLWREGCVSEPVLESLVS